MRRNADLKKWYFLGVATLNKNHCWALCIGPYSLQPLNLAIKLWRILQPGIAICLILAVSSIIYVWTYKKLPRIIRYSPDLNTFLYLNNTNNNLNTNSKMAKYYSIFCRMLFNIRFNIRFEVEYFDLEPSHIPFTYYST